MTLFFQMRTYKYYYSIWVIRKLQPSWIILFNVFFCNIIKSLFFLLFCYIYFFFLHIKFSLVSHAFVSFESIHCILSSSLALNAILLISLVNILRSLRLIFCWDFDISSLVFLNSLWFSLRLSTLTLPFSRWIFLFSVTLLLDNVIIFKRKFFYDIPLQTVSAIQEKSLMKKINWRKYLKQRVHVLTALRTRKHGLIRLINN